jgi:outer membrane protein assembly factor BamB
MTRKLGAALVLVVAMIGADWRQFRGSDSTGIAGDQLPPAKLGADSIAWKVNLPGRGLSSPIVIGDRVFLTACTGAHQDQLHVLAFDTKSGQRLWQRTIWATGPALAHPKTSMAAPTPASDGRHLVALFATNDIVCLDVDGNVRWIRSLYEENPGATDCRGLASSPVIVRDTAVVQVDNQNKSFVVGIDVATGRDRWHINRTRDIAWTTPLVLPAGTPGEELVLLQGSTSLCACDPVTGKEVWKLQRESHPIASGVLVGNALYVPTLTGVAAFELQAEQKPPKLLWEKPKLGPDMASPLVMDGHIYVLRGSILVSADARTGAITGQLRLKGAFSSSIVAGAGLLYCFNENGLGQVVKPDGKDGKLVDSGELKETILCTPAIVDGAIYIRSDQHLWKLGKS